MEGIPGINVGVVKRKRFATMSGAERPPSALGHNPEAFVRTCLRRRCHPAIIPSYNSPCLTRRNEVYSPLLHCESFAASAPRRM